jgi:hypothetical protein
LVCLFISLNPELLFLLYFYRICLLLYFFFCCCFFVIFFGSLLFIAVPRLELPLSFAPVVPTAREAHLAKLRTAIETATAHLLQCRVATKDTMRQMSSAHVAALTLTVSPRGSMASATVAPVESPLLSKADMKVTMAAVKRIEEDAGKALRKAKRDLETAMASEEVPDEDDLTGSLTLRPAGIYLDISTRLLCLCNTISSPSLCFFSQDRPPQRGSAMPLISICPVRVCSCITVHCSHH